MARLGDYVKQIRGVSYQPADLHSSPDDNSVTLLRANNIQDGKLLFDDVVYVDKSRVKAEQLLRKGDILICTSSGSKGLVGKAAFVEQDFPATFGAFCKVVRPIKGNARYIGFFFDSPIYRKKIAEASAGVNINNIRGEHIDELEIRVVSDDDQEKAVAALGIIAALIDKRKKQLQKLDDLVKSRFVEMFGTADDNVYSFPVVRLGDSIKLQGGYAFRSKDYTDKGIPLVQIGNVYEDYLDWEVVNYVSEDYLSQYDSFSLNAGDLVMAMTRPIIKSLNTVKIAKVSEADIPCLLNQRVGRFILSDKVTVPFLEVLCKTDDFKDYVERMSGNSLQPNISSKQVEDYMMVLPPIPLQDSFSCYAKQISKSKLIVQQSLDKLELLKQSLMQKYFG